MIHSNIPFFEDELVSINFFAYFIKMTLQYDILNNFDKRGKF